MKVSDTSRHGHRPGWQIAATIGALALIASILIPTVELALFALIATHPPERRFLSIETVTLNLAEFAFLISAVTTAIAVLIGWFWRGRRTL